MVTQLKFIRNWLKGQETIDTEPEVEEDPNIAFLSSSLNNMLVCGILKGINESLKIHDFIDETILGGRREIKACSYQTLEILDPVLFENVDLKEISSSNE